MKAIKTIMSAVTAAAMAFSAISCMAVSAEVTPDPVISRNVPAYSGAGQASYGNDEHYFSFWSAASPDYLAYDLSAVPDSDKKQVIAVWYNASAFDNIGNYVNRNMEPSDYTIEINAAPGGEYPADGWEIAETVTGNTLSSRQHLVSMEGYNWIRINISKADDEAGKNASINFDIHSVANGISDSWLFLGDSITAGGMNNCYGTGFATHVNNLDDRYFPIQENGGIGGITSTDGKNNIDRWLSVSQAHFVSIAYGTNDAWGNQSGAEKYYENTKYMIDAIRAAGKVPVLPKIPHAEEAGVKDYLDSYNAMVEKLWEEYGDKLVKGPDFDAYLTEHTDWLSGDGVHPNSEGYEEMRRIWAETMYAEVYSKKGNDPDLTYYGDANLDSKVTVADSVAILQHVALYDKYGLTGQALINADVFNNGDGITGKDALVIQQVDAGIFTQSQLPV